MQPHKRLSVTIVLLLAAAFAASANTAEQTRLIALARSVISAEAYGQPQPKLTSHTPAKGVFVTIERTGKVIGCRGSLQPRSKSLEQEITLAARAAASHDPRYAPLTPKDLQDYQVTITIIERLEPASDVSNLRPADGLVLKAGSKVGVVLPWEGKDPQIRLQWAYKKAGVPQGSSCQLQRMTAERFRG